MGKEKKRRGRYRTSRRGGKATGKPEPSEPNWLPPPPRRVQQPNLLAGCEHVLRWHRTVGFCRTPGCRVGFYPGRPYEDSCGGCGALLGRYSE